MSAAERAWSTLTNVAVAAALGGVAYWGHASEWTFGLGRHAAVPESQAAAPTATATGVTFDSAEAAERAGIDVAPVWKATMTDAVPASGELAFDPRTTARLSSRSAGVARRVEKSVGDTVQAGELLAVIDAAEVGRAKAEFQLALVQLRLKRKAADGVRGVSRSVPEQQVREADAARRDAEVRVAAAEQALVNLGLPARAAEYEGVAIDEVVRRMRGLGVGGDPTTANLLPLRSPQAGVVLNRDVVTGESVEPGKVLFVVVDPRRLWLTLHVAADNVSRVVVGQAVRFKPDGSTEEVGGRVAWVGTSADETTRTVPVRAELDNADGRLRASTLGQGRIVSRTTPDAIVVPREAVQMLDGKPVVFVRDPAFLKPGGAKTFHLRPVRTGAGDGTQTEILSGLTLNEIVATKGSATVLSELRRATSTKGVTP